MVSTSPFSAKYSPAQAGERDRDRSPSAEGRGVDAGSPTAARRVAAPGGMAFSPGEAVPFPMEGYGGNVQGRSGFSPFAHAGFEGGRASLSRSVLQGNLSSTFTGARGTRFLDASPRNHMKRPAPPVRQDTLGGRLLYVENLPPMMQWQELKDMFRMSGGTVVRADIAQDGEHRSRGYGTVLFAHEGDAVAAVERFDG